MIASRDRILTTHVGSLPRNEKLSKLLLAQDEGAPYDAAELAAEMDGAGHIYQMVFIMIPLAAPIIGTLAIMNFLGNWNDLIMPLVLMRDEQPGDEPHRGRDVADSARQGLGQPIGDEAQPDARRRSEGLLRRALLAVDHRARQLRRGVALHDQHALSGFGQIRGGGQPVVPRADDQDVKRVAPVGHSKSLSREMPRGRCRQIVCPFRVVARTGYFLHIAKSK